MPTTFHFPIFIVVSLVAFVGVLKLIFKTRPSSPTRIHIFTIATVVVVGGMLFAKYGANTGLHWTIYYGAPALLTLLLPPMFFAMNKRETLFYLLLAFFVSPLIHGFFSFFIGWKEYMPFIPIPSIWELLQ